MRNLPLQLPTLTTDIKVDPDDWTGGVSKYLQSRKLRNWGKSSLFHGYWKRLLEFFDREDVRKMLDTDRATFLDITIFKQQKQCRKPGKRMVYHRTPPWATEIAMATMYRILKNGKRWNMIRRVPHIEWTVTTGPTPMVSFGIGFMPDGNSRERKDTNAN